MRPILIIALAGLGLSVGCAQDASGPGAAGGGKADDGAEEARYPIRLERATPVEVAERFTARMTQQLENCFEAYKEEHDPDAVMITRGVLEELMANYPPYGGADPEVHCIDWWDVRDTVETLMELHGRSRAYPETVAEWFEPWALSELEVATVDGYVRFGELPLVFYDDLVAVQNQNAIAREQHPEGVDLGAIRAAWAEVQSDTTLDRAYLNPVLLDPAALESDGIFDAMREAFPLGYAGYVSFGTQAVEDFWHADEGPEGDPAFEPIAEALSEPSIEKAFYFAGGFDAWSTNVLLVVDEHGQTWGMQMGYSE
jgi:hypothetical protein